MTLHAIESGNFKLDGGAMFGVVPKKLWSRTNPADGNNMIEMAARCLLIEEGNRLILIDTGMGNKQSEKFYSYYDMDHRFDLDSSLRDIGFHKNDITDVLLTHLHFDHCGGAISKDGNLLMPSFKYATYYSNESHWQWATQPNRREKASFLPENILPIKESGQLEFLKTGNGLTTINSLGMKILCVDGHTEKQMIPHIYKDGKTFVFMADLLPTAGHLPIPYIMGYDTRPLISLDEKEQFLSKAARENYYLILEHDPYHEIITVKETDKGVRLDQKFTFKELFQ